VALAALRRIMRRLDGRDPRPPGPAADLLTDRICRALGIDGPSKLVGAIYAPACDRTRIAALAAAVVATAGEDPELARSILEPAGADLAETVAAVARALGWTGGPIPLAMAGGFLLSAPPVSRSLLEHLGRAGLVVEATPVPQPVLGAVALAKRALAADAGRAVPGDLPIEPPPAKPVN
jgi:N-acetylglucosamine kinase-like BadF-type ATPase